MKKISSITLLGSSSGRNAGDAALLSGIMEAIDAEIGAPLSYYIPTYRPNYIRDNYHNNPTPVSMLPWHLSCGMLGPGTFAAVAKSDLTLIFDAILFDRSLYNPLTNYLISALILAKWAKICGKKVGCYSVGLGPVTSGIGRTLLRILLESMDFIALRDIDSAKLLKDLKVTNNKVFLTADAALNASAATPDRVQEMRKELQIPDNTELISFNVNKYIDSWAEDGNALTVDKFVAEYGSGVGAALKEIGKTAVAVVTQHSDMEITERVASVVKQYVPVTICSNVRYNHYEIKGFLGGVSLHFGMRLHSIILASSMGSPVLGIAFQKKVESYLNSIGLPESILKFNNFSRDTVRQHLLSGWHRRHDIKKIIQERMPSEKAKAAGTAKLLLDNLIP